MRKDDQVKAAIGLKKSFVISTGWEIICEDEDVREFITKNFDELHKESPMESSFDDVLTDILSSYEYGFSLSEPIFSLNEQKLYVYKSIKTRPPHTFMFHIDKFGNVQSIEQSTAEGPKQLAPDVFLHHVYQPSFGNPYGESDFSAAHPDWKAKKFIKRFMAIYLEKFAGPTVVGKYNRNWQDDEIAEFKSILESVQNNTTLVMPEGAVVDFVQNQKDSSDVYIKAIDHLNTSIARALLVPDLLGVSGGQTKGGAYSLGVKQFEVFLGTIKKDRKSLERKITSKLVQPLARINFGEDIKAEFRFVPYTEDNIIEYAKLWVQAVTGKVWNPSDEEINHLRKLVGFPEGEVERPEPVPAPILPGVKPEPDSTKKTGGKTEADPKEEDDTMDAPEKGRQMSAFVPVYTELDPVFKFAERQKTPYEYKMSFTEIVRTLDAREKALSDKLASSGKDIIASFVDQIKKKGLLRRFDPSKIETLEPKFLRPMNQLFSEHLQTIYRDAYSQAQTELVNTGPRKFDAAMLPEKFIEIIKASAFSMVGDYTDGLTKKARGILIDAVKNGIGEAEAVREIRAAMEDQSDKWIKTVVRTKTTDMYNQARRSYWENDDIAKQIVEAYQYSAVMDDRTSDVCRALDGKVFDKSDPDIGRVTPPLHYNCRGILVPVTKFEEYKAVKVPSIQKIDDLGGNLKSFKGVIQ